MQVDPISSTVFLQAYMVDYIKKGLENHAVEKLRFIDNSVDYNTILLCTFGYICIQIQSYDHFWNWTENALLQGLYNKDWYNGDVQEDRVIQDLHSISVGGARLRQLRVNSGQYSRTYLN